MPFPSYMPKPNWLSLKMLALKLKLYIVNCEIHGEEKVLEFFEGDSAFNMDFEIEKTDKIYKELASSLYMRYSAILMLIHCDCSCRNKILVELLKAIQSNKYLQYKFKLIYTSYNLKPQYKNHTKIWASFFEKHVTNLKHPADLKKLFNSYEIDQEHVTLDDKEVWRDYLSFQFSKLENIFLFQLFMQKGDWLYRAQQLDYIFYIVDCLPFISVQQLLEFININQLAVHGKGNVELYFYSINPALAIINNNYIFANTKPGICTREGSEKDVLKLIRELKIARIPYILTEDFSRAQFVDLVKYLKHKNLKTLKSLIFIIMSHASENNIIYTHDAELSFIEDILLPLQSNETLKQAHISYVNVHCRGGLNAQNSDPDEFDEIQPTQIDQLQSNNLVFYSVPDLVISPRRSKNGTPFVQSFCKSFRNLKSQSDIRILFEKICSDLRNNSYYAYLDCFDKSSEWVVGDETKSYCIKPTPMGASEFIPFVESIEQEFHTLHKMKPKDRATIKLWLRCHIENLKKVDQNATTISSESATTPFCICANVNEQTVAKNLDQLKYFAAELDEDTGIIEESIS